MTSTIKKTTKPKVASIHPKYNEMVKVAISALKERSGSSRIAIFKYNLANYNVGNEEKKIISHLKTCFKLGAVVKPVKKDVKKVPAKIAATKAT